MELNLYSTSLRDGPSTPVDFSKGTEGGSHWIDYDDSKPTCFTNRCRITDEQFMLATAGDDNYREGDAHYQVFIVEIYSRSITGITVLHDALALAVSYQNSPPSKEALYKGETGEGPGLIRIFLVAKTV